MVKPTAKTQQPTQQEIGFTLSWAIERAPTFAAFAQLADWANVVPPWRRINYTRLIAATEALDEELGPETRLLVRRVPRTRRYGIVVEGAHAQALDYSVPLYVNVTGHWDSPVEYGSGNRDIYDRLMALIPPTVHTSYVCGIITYAVRRMGGIPVRRMGGVYFLPIGAAERITELMSITKDYGKVWRFFVRGYAEEQQVIVEALIEALGQIVAVVEERMRHKVREETVDKLARQLGDALQLATVYAGLLSVAQDRVAEAAAQIRALLTQVLAARDAGDDATIIPEPCGVPLELAAQAVIQ